MEHGSIATFYLHKTPSKEPSVSVSVVVQEFFLVDVSGKEMFSEFALKHVSLPPSLLPSLTSFSAITLL